MRHVICNKIKTPDGTILVSNYRHDYKEYEDANGLVYSVDGGNDYLRRILNHDAPHEELSVYSDDDHKKVREVFLWGTYGKKEDWTLGILPECVFKKLKDLTTNHINAILETQKQLPEWRRDIFKNELKYRLENEIDYLFELLDIKK